MTEPGPAAASAGELQLLCLEVAGQRCALLINVVVEIHAAVQLMPLPDAPEVVLGLMNRRGQPVPVLDLRRRLGLPTRPMQAEDRLAVVRLPDREVALLADAAVDVLPVPAASVDDAIAASNGALHRHGVAVLRDGLLVVLDVAAFLSEAEALGLDDALQQALAARA